MPFNLIETDCSPVFKDYEYEIVDKKLLAGYVAELLLGHHYHVMRILQSLSTRYPEHPNHSIDSVINKITATPAEKRDGWLFQMISWIVLSKRNSGNKFFSNYPHFAPAQHGIDGLAITLNPDNSLRNIIITEDKCTTGPRNKITQQVFPEFESFESGKKNNALVAIISSLLGQLDAGRILEQVQNQIFRNDYRLYRIGITRKDEHNSIEGRKDLFLNYEICVPGDTADRRSCASIYIEDLRSWMEDFSKIVVEYLVSKKA